MRTLKSVACLAVVASALLVVRPAGAIVNERGKTYKLTDTHGPWMIMVASFRNIRDEDRKTEGLSAEDAAAELVFELREKGIPAYAYSQDGKVETIETHDRLGRDDTRIFAAQRDMICVLAGNYETIDDAIAQKTLNYVKKLHPKFLKNTKSGAVVRATAQKGPLAGAFMTINPLRKPGEVARQRVDDETKFLNSGIDHALVGVKKKYTVKIATFAGKSATPIGNSRYTGREGLFERELQNGSKYNIVRAGEDAAQLARALRHKGYAAYVYHDKFQSIVTMGGFDSKDDPTIQEIFKAFGAKMKADPNSRSHAESLTAEVLTLSGDSPDKPAQTWIFDPVPEIIEVPRIR
ncbi:MAG: hypothetical protein AABP62_14005 [Planctomycetota bacterium]